MHTSKETQTVTVRMPTDEHQALRNYAHFSNTSINDIMLAALRTYMTDHQRDQDFETYLEEARTTWRGALDKLADL